MAKTPSPPQLVFSVNLTEAQANVMLDALQAKLAKEGGDEQRAATILAIESILNSGIAHSKER
jgi:hypothetical protein